MDKLSADLLFSIFQELDAKTLCVVSRVSKDFNVVADSDATWLSVHGFAKWRSLEILSRERTAISKMEDSFWNVRQRYQSAGEVYFRRDTGRDGDAEALARENYESAYWIHKAAKRDLDKAVGDLAISYQMLRVPLRLRVAAAKAIDAYYKVCRASHGATSKEIFGVDAARIYLTKLDRDVTLLVNTSELGTGVTFWWAATCCARSLWATQ